MGPKPVVYLFAADTFPCPPLRWPTRFLALVPLGCLGLGKYPAHYDEFFGSGVRPGVRVSKEVNRQLVEVTYVPPVECVQWVSPTRIAYQRISPGGLICSTAYVV